MIFTLIECDTFHQSSKEKITFTKEHGKFEVILDYENPHHLQIVVNKSKNKKWENWLEVELSLDMKNAMIFGSKKNLINS